PLFGRAIVAGDATSIPSTRELQIQSVAVTAPILAVSGIVLCAGVVVAFWWTVPAWLLLGWAAMAIAATAVMPIMLRHVGLGVIDEVEAAKIIRLITAISVVRALAWGIGAAVFYAYASPIQLTLLSVLVLGNAMGAGSALISIPPAAMSFALCA